MKKLLIPCLSFALVSCGSTRYLATGTSQEKYQRVKPSRVVVLTTPPAAGAATEMGLIIANVNDEFKAYVRAKDVASDNRANAIYMVSAKDQTAGQAVSNVLLGTNMRGKYRFIAYRLQEQPTAQTTEK